MLVPLHSYCTYLVGYCTGRVQRLVGILLVYCWQTAGSVMVLCGYCAGTVQVLHNTAQKRHSLHAALYGQTARPLLVVCWYSTYIVLVVCSYCTGLVLSVAWTRTVQCRHTRQSHDQRCTVVYILYRCPGRPRQSAPFRAFQGRPVLATFPDLVSVTRHFSVSGAGPPRDAIPQALALSS